MQVFNPPLFPRGQIISSLLSDRLTLKFLLALPSSVHEVLAVSTELTEPEELAQMVAEVNMQKVALESCS